MEFEMPLGQSRTRDHHPLAIIRRGKGRRGANFASQGGGTGGQNAMRMVRQKRNTELDENLKDSC